METICEVEDYDYVETIDFSGLLEGGDVVYGGVDDNDNVVSTFQGGELGHETIALDGVLTEEKFESMLYDMGLNNTQAKTLSDLVYLCKDMTINGKRPVPNPEEEPNHLLRVVDDVWSSLQTLFNKGGTLEYRNTSYLGMITPTSIKTMHLSKRLTTNMGCTNAKGEIIEVSGMGWDQVSAYYQVNKGTKAHIGVLMFVVGSIGVGHGNGYMWASNEIDYYGTYSIVENDAVPINLMTEVSVIPTTMLVPYESYGEEEFVIGTNGFNNLVTYGPQAAPDLIVIVNGLDYLVEKEITVNLLKTGDGFYDREMCKKYPVVERLKLRCGTIECVVRDGVLHSGREVMGKPDKISVIESAFKRPDVSRVVQFISKEIQLGSRLLPFYPTVDSAAKFFSQSREMLDMRQVYYLSAIYGHRFTQEKVVAVRKKLQSFVDPVTRSVKPQDYDYLEFYSFDQLNIDRTAKYSMEGLVKLIESQGLCVDMRVLRHRIQMELSVYGDACYFNDISTWICPQGLEDMVDDMFLRNGGLMRYNDVVNCFRNIKHDHIDGEPRDLVRYMIRSGKYIYINGNLKLFPRGVSVWLRHQYRFVVSNHKLEDLKHKFRGYMRYSPFSRKLLEIPYGRMYANSKKVVVGVKNK